MANSIRKNALIAIKDKIGSLSVNGKEIRTENTDFDPTLRLEELPKFAIVPQVENMHLLFGLVADRTLTIRVYGYVPNTVQGAGMEAEDILQAVLDILKLEETVDEFSLIGFNIENIGPIMIEQFEMQDIRAYLSMPLQIVLLDT